MHQRGFLICICAAEAISLCVFEDENRQKENSHLGALVIILFNYAALISKQLMHYTYRIICLCQKWRQYLLLSRKRECCMNF